MKTYRKCASPSASVILVTWTSVTPTILDIQCKDAILCHVVISWSVFFSIIYTFHFISLVPLLCLMCCSHQCDILIWKLQGNNSRGRPSLDGRRIFIFIITEHGVRMWTGLTGIWFCQVEDICEYCNELYLVHVHAPISLFQISTNKCTHIL